ADVLGGVVDAQTVERRRGLGRVFGQGGEVLVARVEEGPVGGEARRRGNGEACVELDALPAAGAAVARVTGERVERLLIADVHPKERRRRAQRRAIEVAVELESRLVIPGDDWRQRRIADHAVRRSKA